MLFELMKQVKRYEDFLFQSSFFVNFLDFVFLPFYNKEYDVSIEKMMSTTFSFNLI